MLDDLLAPAPRWQRWLSVLTWPVSIALHVLAALLLLHHAATAHTVDDWIEMAVVAPPPPPPPELPPEPPKPEVKKPRQPPKAVDFKDTVPEAKAKEEPPQRVVRKIQGLSASSFATGSGTGVSVRAGTTTSVAATHDLMSLDEAADGNAIPVALVTTQPRNCSKPPVEVPKEAIDNNIEGTIAMSLDLDVTGAVVGVHLQGHMGYGIDEACIAAAKQIRCKPARRGDEAVPVTGYPHRCTIKGID